jgi:hypothetical protein
MKSNYTKVRFVKVHPSYSYNVGDIAIVIEDRIDQMFREGYIELLPYDYEESPLPQKPVVVPTVEVEWINARPFEEDGIPAFAYNTGDKCKLTPDHAEKLFLAGYVKISPEDKSFYSRMMKKLNIR